MRQSQSSSSELLGSGAESAQAIVKMPVAAHDQAVGEEQDGGVAIKGDDGLAALGAMVDAEMSSPPRQRPA